MVTRDRETRVRAALAADLIKHLVHLLTGIGRSTIDRILGDAVSGGAINGPSGGRNDH